MSKLYLLATGEEEVVPVIQCTYSEGGSSLVWQHFSMSHKQNKTFGDFSTNSHVTGLDRKPTTPYLHDPLLVVIISSAANNCAQAPCPLHWSQTLRGVVTVRTLLLSAKGMRLSPPQIKRALLTLRQIAVITAVVADSRVRTCGQEVDGGEKGARKQHTCMRKREKINTVNHKEIFFQPVSRGRQQPENRTRI